VNALSLIPMMSWMNGGIDSWPMRRAAWRKDRLEGVDVDAEYELIKAKKSRLPRSLRDRITAMKEAE